MNHLNPSFERYPFHGDLLDVVVDVLGVWISILSVCRALGLSRRRQQRVLEDASWATRAQRALVGADGKRRLQLCIRLDRLPMWLATISPRRVRPEVRERLIAYQCEAADVLAEHFLGRRLSAPPEFPPEPPPPPPPKLLVGKVALDRVTEMVVGNALARKVDEKGPLGRLCQILHEAKLSQSQLAKRAGYSPGMVSMVFTGKVSPTLEFSVAVGRELGEEAKAILLSRRVNEAAARKVWDRGALGRLYQLLHQAELSQSQLAARIGYSAGLVSGVFVGRVNPTEEFAALVGRELGQEAREILLLRRASWVATAPAGVLRIGHRARPRKGVTAWKQFQEQQRRALAEARDHMSQLRVEGVQS